MDDLRRDEGLTPEPVPADAGAPEVSGPAGGSVPGEASAAGHANNDNELRVSPASPSDLEDDLPDFQPGEGPGQTPGQ